MDASVEGFFPFKEVDRHVPQDAEIFRGMVFSYTAMVFPEGYVQTPVQAIFNTPMIPDGLGDRLSMVFEAGDKEGCFRRYGSANIPLADGHSDGVDAGPQVFSRKPVDIVGCKVSSGFDAAMLSIDGLKKVKGAIGGILEE